MKNPACAACCQFIAIFIGFAAKMAVVGIF
jgi:hypothetical protein